MGWSLADPLTRTFLTFPIFTALVFISAGWRFSRGFTWPPVFMPALYGVTVLSVLALWADAMGTRAAGDLMTTGWALTLPVAAATVALILLTPVLHFAELAAGAFRERVVAWFSARGSERLAAFRSGASLLVIPDMGVAPPAPMTRAEAFDAARVISRSPATFAAISVITAIAEELLYRGAMLYLLGQHLDASLAVAIQAMAYALNHVAFGVTAVVSKLLFGAVLGVSVVLADSLVPAIAAHCLFQFLVWRRFRKLDA